MSDPTPQALTVPAELGGQRLDRALARFLPGVSRTRIQELVRDGGVRVGGEIVRKPALALEPGWRVEILEVPRSRQRPGSAPDAELVPVHEDAHLVVVAKPPGMVVHPTSIVRGRTVSELAVERWGPLPAPQGEDRPGIVHRLDADTSGLLVLARSAEAAAGLVEAFRRREVEKEYLALVHGAPRFDSDWIEAPLGRSPERSDRVTVVEPGEGREARTWYETRERFAGFARVLCRPLTGRTHQLRVHLSWIDHPIVGDRVYRGRRGLDRHVPRGAPPAERHFLHARRLAFRHPVTGERLELRVDPPADLRAWLEWLRRERALPGD